MRNLLGLVALTFILATPAYAFTSSILGNPIAVQQSAAAENSHIFKTSAGFLYGISVALASTSGYLMLFDATTVPADGAVTPIVCYPIASAINQPISIPYPIPFQNGIVAAFSTTGCFSKTGSPAFFAAQVK